MEERVLCQAIVHNLRLMLLFEVESALSCERTLPTPLITGCCRIHLPKLLLKAELFIYCGGGHRLMPLISILVVGPLASLVLSLISLRQF